MAARLDMVEAPRNPCDKCSDQEATLKQRSQAVCKICYVRNISTKCGKTIGTLGKELGPIEANNPRRLLVGLSLGVSSTSLVDLLHTYCAQLKEKGRRLQFEILVVFVDTGSDGSSVSAGAQALQKFRDKYQLFSFHRVPVSSAVELRTIDWSALPPLAKEQDPDGQIRSLFEQLPSTTSRADLLRLLIRHLLVSKALDTSCQAILLGHSTTALAELTLAETAKGRGFSLPWQTNDGPLAFSDTTRATNGSGSELNFRNSERRGSIMFYHPLKDVLRKELLTYTTLTDPSLTSLIPGSGEKTNVVVSHKDVSIEEIMVRYFAEVEENYPG
ncbi:hypothetical protein P8C59_003878 [Phyllachora maydis]|uniref:Cytoplasmic tRNA 2-thiolation protein 2 n=1 Tax=Phyllachora maydis TaxID=1825666 RepID=A0AAD9MDS5_9PEZI|nr:hypothetical protein P8C59_003878 [Phyllachora maydis]